MVPAVGVPKNVEVAMKVGTAEPLVLFARTELAAAAPKEVTFDPDYKGYRAGLQLVNGSWRFAYFVSAPPASEVRGQ